MRILDRYVLKSTFTVFFTCLLTFILLYIIIDTFSHLDEILKQKTSINILANYYLSYLPIIFVQVAPIACLLATLYTFGRLNRYNEIVAMRSSGLSIFQISKTVIIFGAIVSLFVFWVNDRLLPSSLSLTEKIKTQIENGTKRYQGRENEVLTNLSMYGLRNRLFFVNQFSLATDTMEGITILEHDENQNLIKKIVANKGVYNDGLWRFYQCITYTFDADGQIRQEPEYHEEEIMTILETPREFLNQRQHTDFMNIAQINDYIWKLSKSGATTVIRNLKIDLYHRFSAPFTSIIIIMLGIPFSMMIKKRAGLSSLGIAIIIGFLYYVVDAVSIALGKSGALMPCLSVSLAHLMALMTSLYLIKSIP